MNVTAERREVTKTKLFISIDGEEFEAARVIDFLEKLMGTDGFMTGVRNVNGRDRALAELLEDYDAAGHSHSAGWFETDEEVINELWTEAMVLFYDDLDREDLTPDDYR